MANDGVETYYEDGQSAGHLEIVEQNVFVLALSQENKRLRRSSCGLDCFVNSNT